MAHNSVLVASFLAAAIALPLAQDAGWRAAPAVVERVSREQPGFNYDEAKVSPYSLPSLLAGERGIVREPAAWRDRRVELLRQFRDQVYGRAESRPEQLRFQVIEEQPRAMDGAATLKRIAALSRVGSREHRFEFTLFLPNARTGPVPVFLLLNNRPVSNTDPTRREKSAFWPAEELVARGYGIAALQNGDLAPDDKDHFRDGVIRLFEGDGPALRPRNAWGALAAWGWGGRRVMDYFETDPRIDANRIAIVGHSRGGKAALWAGAEDERFALVISNESGEGGAALARRAFGETTARITATFPHWFNEHYRAYAGREADLPVDQHMLLALIAPRALYVASADEDLWSDPRGEFLALAQSSPAFALFGQPAIATTAMPPLDTPLVAGHRGYHIRRGVHDLTLYDWQRFADFADSLGWKK
jgi:hypothetical protein